MTESQQKVLLFDPMSSSLRTLPRASYKEDHDPRALVTYIGDSALGSSNRSDLLAGTILKDLASLTTSE